MNRLAKVNAKIKVNVNAKVKVNVNAKGKVNVNAKVKVKVNVTVKAVSRSKLSSKLRHGERLGFG